MLDGDDLTCDCSIVRHFLLLKYINTQIFFFLYIYIKCTQKSLFITQTKNFAFKCPNLWMSSKLAGTFDSFEVKTMTILEILKEIGPIKNWKGYLSFE